MALGWGGAGLALGAGRFFGTAFSVCFRRESSPWFANFGVNPISAVYFRPVSSVGNGRTFGRLSSSRASGTTPETLGSNIAGESQKESSVAIHGVNSHEGTEWNRRPKHVM